MQPVWRYICLASAGWQVVSRIVLVPGKAVYLHPDRVKEDLQELTRAWIRWEKVTARTIICGDFNKADRADRVGWEQFLSHTGTCDVAPDLMTHVTAQSTSNLDRCLISEDWIASAQWNPILKATHTQNFGHRIVQIQLRVRPTVLSNPRHRKHDTIPASVFMPGKDGNPAQAGTEALQGLIRLLHRTRARYLCHYLPSQGPTQQRHAGSSLFGQRAVAGEELSSSRGDLSNDLILQRYCSLGDGCVEPSSRLLVDAGTLVSAHFSFSACFWAWWKSQPNPMRNDTLAPASSLVNT